MNPTLQGSSSLGAWGCSALWNVEVRSIIFPFPFALTSQQKEEKEGCGESVLLGTRGEGREQGFVPL